MCAYLKNVHCHLPQAAIAKQILRQVGYETIVNRQAGVLDHQLEVVVGLVKFVPEEEV